MRDQVSRANLHHALHKAASYLSLPLDAISASACAKKRRELGEAPAATCSGEDSAAGTSGRQPGQGFLPCVETGTKATASLPANTSAHIPEADVEQRIRLVDALGNEGAGAQAEMGEQTPPPPLFEGCVLYFDGRTGDLSSFHLSKLVMLYGGMCSVTLSKRCGASSDFLSFPCC